MVRYLLFFLVVACVPAFSQNQLSTRSKKAIEYYVEADNYRVRGEFGRAIQLLNQALDKDKKFVEAWYRLGLVYVMLKDYEAAIRNFEAGLALTDDPRKQHLFWFDLGGCYFAIGNYEKAGDFLERFLAGEKANGQKIARAKVLMESIQFVEANQGNASSYKVRKLSNVVNSFVMQYFPVLTADQQQLIFTRRIGGGPNEDEDLVVSHKDDNGEWGPPESISENINSESNEGTCTISADGRKLIFTSCLGREGYGSCDLYESRKVGEAWSKPRNLGMLVNSGDWESQPALSADGRTLYFVSDRRGGYGRRDIWVTTMNEKGGWNRARNLGREVNTPYDEISPFIHANNRTLYFASNGLIGFGGYDIFFTERDSADRWSVPENLGAPINTHQDQFSLYITADGRKGYYAHEEPRDGGYSVSYIYEVGIPPEDQIRVKSNYVKGVVRDKDTTEPLLASIELVDLETENVESLVESDSLTGKYLIVLSQGAEYALYVSKPGYLFQSLYFNYSEVEDFQPIILDVALERVKPGSISILENIFFDVDKYELKEKSMTELQKLIRFLSDNPAIRIEIGGHTDNSGSSAYNEALSRKRAAAVHDYLVGRGVEPGRLTMKGYGASHPIADNGTDKGRQRNRRIEFRILP